MTTEYLVILPTQNPLGTQPQQRKHLSQIYKALCLFAFIRRQGFASVLTIQQFLKPMINAFRQFKPL